LTQYYSKVLGVSLETEAGVLKKLSLAGLAK
jgi:hypothetical protein